MVLKENLSNFDNWEDINKSDVIVAVTLGTVQEQYAKILFPKSKTTKHAFRIKI